MQTTPRSPAPDAVSTRTVRDPHQALWPWALALLVAVTLSGWWAWDLFKAPELDAAHPILPMRPPKDLGELSPTAAGASHAGQAGQGVGAGITQGVPEAPEAPASQARSLSW